MYETNNNELYHYGVKGMKWGRRKFYNKDGNLNKRGRVFNEYANATQDRRKAYDKYRKARRNADVTVDGAVKINKAYKDYLKADEKVIFKKAKYAAVKAKSPDKAKKAEMRTYVKELYRRGGGSGGSDADVKSGGRTTSMLKRIQAEKGKTYANKVQKKVNNIAVSAFIGSTAVAVGQLALSYYLSSNDSKS